LGCRLLDVHFLSLVCPAKEAHPAGGVEIDMSTVSPVSKVDPIVFCYSPTERVDIEVRQSDMGRLRLSGHNFCGVGGLGAMQCASFCHAARVCKGSILGYFSGIISLAPAGFPKVRKLFPHEWFQAPCLVFPFHDASHWFLVVVLSSCCFEHKEFQIVILDSVAAEERASRAGSIFVKRECPGIDTALLALLKLPLSYPLPSPHSHWGRRAGSHGSGRWWPQRR
jgi:hypothetical protein